MLLQLARCAPRNLDRKRARDLLLYLVYAEIILIGGIRGGAFHTRTGIFDAEIAAAQNSLIGTPAPPLAKGNPLPGRYLGF